jgi:hypothetical protein
MLTMKSIDAMIDATAREAKTALEKSDFAAVAALMRKIGEFEDAKMALEEIEDRLRGLQTSPTPTTFPSGNDKLRELPVEITGGMVREHYLSLTKHVKQRRITVGEDLTIEAYPSRERFQTVVLSKGNKLQERAATRRFYQDAGVHDGDFVVLTEVAPKQWTLKKAPPGQYQSRRSFLRTL